MSNIHRCSLRVLALGCCDRAEPSERAERLAGSPEGAGGPRTGSRERLRGDGLGYGCSSWQHDRLRELDARGGKLDGPVPP